jgi:ketosteroid isomerase-like protein
MKRLITSIVFGFIGIGVSAAQPPKASQNPTDIAAIKQISQDMGDAMVHVDIDKLNQIYADDFVTVGRSGKVITKADLLTNFQSFHDKLESFENGPIDVQVFGNFAVANGTVSEKRIRDGKSADGEFLWMDLLEKRAGKWQVVRSADSRIKGGKLRAPRLRRPIQIRPSRMTMTIAALLRNRCASRWVRRAVPLFAERFRCGIAQRCAPVIQYRDQK